MHDAEKDFPGRRITAQKEHGNIFVNLPSPFFGKEGGLAQRGTR
jgi:hypothetical protein